MSTRYVGTVATWRDSASTVDANNPDGELAHLQSPNCLEEHVSTVSGL